MPLLALLFIVLPIVELYLIVQVAQSIGVLETVALLVVIAVLGVWVVRRQGVGLLSRMQAEVNAGQVPTTTLLDGVMILAGGVLLVAPGFLTDVFGLLLLVPPTRTLLRGLLVRRYRKRAQFGTTSRVGRFGRVVVVESHSTMRPPGPDGADRPRPSPGPLGPGGGDVVEVESHPVPPRELPGT